MQSGTEQRPGRIRESEAAALAGAERACASAGLRLTKKRRQLLTALLRARSPLSAYDLAEVYRNAQGEALPAMTVYRMLDAFVSAGIVHKLRSTNRFMACRHISCKHPHPNSHFLICDRCGQVREMNFTQAELSLLERRARALGFHLKQEQLELHGLCQDCQDCAEQH
jgi:Fur family zinc uptake transcriptional regulator